MKYCKCECKENDGIPVLSNDTIKEIEQFVGKEVPYIFAFDNKANLSILIKETSEAKEIDFPNNPIKSDQIFDLEAVNLLRIKGSHKHIMKHGGTTIVIDLPAPHPPE